jgi:dipeptidase
MGYTRPTFSIEVTGAMVSDVMHAWAAQSLPESIAGRLAAVAESQAFDFAEKDPIASKQWEDFAATLRALNVEYRQRATREYLDADKAAATANDGT